MIFFILVFVALIGFKAASSGIKAKQKNKTLKKTINIKKNISQDLIRINKLYKSGAINKKEFKKAKDKILKN